MKSRVNTDEAKAMRAQGMTLAAIGEHFGVSRERVRQILGSGSGNPHTECVGCGGPLPEGSRPHRRWCSDNCRRRTWDKENPPASCRCGRSKSRTSAQCFECYQADFDAKRHERRTRIATLWAEGLPAKDIAPAVGYSSVGALSVELHKMRVEGWPVKTRRAGWTGHNTPVGPKPRPIQTEAEGKRRAHNILHGAVHYGKVIKPDACERCGTKGRVEGHHHDYTKALDVEWLCRSCHVAHHVAERRAA
jgi:hypothetical protein